MINPETVWLQCEHNRKDFLTIQRKINAPDFKLKHITNSYSDKSTIVRLNGQ